MTKVIIELTRDYTGNEEEERTELLGVSVSVELEDEGDIGPHDVVAAAIKRRIPQVLNEVGNEVASLMGDFGVSARFELFPCIKH